MSHSGPIVAQRQTKNVKGEAFLATVIDCQSCGYAHFDPLPTIEELGQFYAYHFYEKQKPDYLEKMERESEYWLEMYKWRFNILKKHLSSKDKPKVLDVGSSGGFFLAAAQSQGAEVLGIEPSDKAADYSRKKFNVPVQVNIYEKCDIANESFDVIHSSLVIEHLLNPRHFIQWSFEKLRPGGVVVIETPHEFNNYQNLLTKKMGYEPWYVAYPDHLNYFSQASLQGLCKSCGLDKVQSLCSFPMEQFVIQGLDYVKDGSLGIKAHQQRMNFELNHLKNGQNDLLEKTYENWAQLNVGRTQIGVFKKK